MPVTATSTATVNNPNIIYNDDIRGFLRDVAGRIPGTGSENILFSELPQFSDAEIARAEKFTVSRFNVMTPVTTWVPQNIPLWLMLLGVTDFLLLSETFRQARNQLTYGDGDVQPIGIDDKAQLYQAIEQTVKAEFEEKAKAFKIYNNLNACYGALGSGYRNVSRFSHAS